MSKHLQNAHGVRKYPNLDKYLQSNPYTNVIIYNYTINPRIFKHLL